MSAARYLEDLHDALGEEAPVHADGAMDVVAEDPEPHRRRLCHTREAAEAAILVPA